MPQVVVTRTAEDDLLRLIDDHQLPGDTAERVRARLRPLGRFPAMGRELGGRWEGTRCLIGPWPWMLLIYQHLEDLDIVAVTTVQDARHAASATSEEG